VSELSRAHVPRKDDTHFLRHVLNFSCRQRKLILRARMQEKIRAKAARLELYLERNRAQAERPRRRAGPRSR
jgi:hypothetical protein